MIYQEKFEIIINNDKKLTISELLVIRSNIYYRLQGYTTECPESIKNADIIIKYVNVRETRKLKLQNINKLWLD